MVKSNKTGREVTKTNLNRKFYEIFEVGAMQPKKYAAFSITQAKARAKKLLDTKKRIGRKVVIREIKEIYAE